MRRNPVNLDLLCSAGCGVAVGAADCGGRGCGTPRFVKESRDARATLFGVLAAMLMIAAGTPAPAPADEIRPLDAIFVIDNSGSMRSNDSSFATRQVVTDFASKLMSDSRVGIVLFDERAELIEPLSEDVGPGSAARWTEKLRRVDYAGQLTDSPAGIERAIYELKNRGRANADKVIIFITDGIVDTGDRQRDADKKRWLTDSLASEGGRPASRYSASRSPRRQMSSSFRHSRSRPRASTSASIGRVTSAW